MKLLKGIKPPPLVIIIIAAVFVLSLAGGTYAWLQQVRSKQLQLNATNTFLTTDVFFLQDNGSRVPVPRDSNGYYIASQEDENDADYVGRLNVTLKFKGTTKSYLRVYIGDMWLNDVNVGGDTFEETAYLKEDTKFITLSSWLDNRWYDKYYYFAGDYGFGRGVVYNLSLNDEITFELVKGIDDVVPLENGKVYFEIRAEAVQFNRIEAFWGITDIPSA